MNAPSASSSRIRVGEGGRAEHDAVGARRERAPDRRERAQAAAQLDRHGQLARDPLDVVEVDRLALAGAVEIDHVQEARARLDERARRLERVVGVDRLLVEVALAQPDRLAVADVDRGQQDHAATRAQARTKLPSSASPCGPDFSGMGLQAEDRRAASPRGDDAHELRAVLRRAEHVLWPRRPRRERVRVVEGARVGQPLVQHAAPSPGHAGSSRSAAPAAPGRPGPRPGPPAARCPRRRRARWSTRTRAACPCIDRSRARRRPRARAGARRAAAGARAPSPSAWRRRRAARRRRPRARARGRW